MKTLEIVQRIAEHTGRPARRSGRGWQACCPAHEDRKPSLCIAEGDAGRTLLTCFAGCPAERIAGALGLEMRDLFDGNGHGSPAKQKLAVEVKAWPNIQDAFRDVAPREGTLAGAWDYTPSFVVARWNLPDGSKTFRPFHRGEDGHWRLGDPPGKLPLYRVDELPADGDGPVFVHEGEKCADKGWTIGLLSTTSAHGAKAPSKTDWTPLAGRDVVILPDNDPPGQAYAEAVARILTALDPPACVRIVNLPGLPPSGDIIDYTTGPLAGKPEAEIKAEILRLTNTIPLVQWAANESNSRQGNNLHSVANSGNSVSVSDISAQKYECFPTEALPLPVRRFVTEAAEALGCDPAYVALPLLAVLGAAVGNTTRIRLKQDWLEPPVLWTCIVGESGTLKTPACDFALRDIRRRQAEEFEAFREAQRDYEQELLEYERELALWKKSKSKGEPPEKPQPPVARRLWADDTTCEALAAVLEQNPRGVLLATDELGTWLHSFDRYRDRSARGGDIARWCSMHRAGPIVVDRKTAKGPLHIPSAFVCLTGGIQPGTLRRALTPEYFEAGLAARLLLAFPPRRVKKWTEAEISKVAAQRMQDLLDRLFEMEADVDERERPTPRMLGFTQSGKAAWVAFYASHARREAEASGDMAAALSKLEGQAARLALIIHCVRVAAEDPTLERADAIDGASVDAGVQLVAWFAHEAERVYRMLGESAEEAKRRELVEWIQRRGGEATVRVLMHSNSRFATAEQAKQELDALVASGLGSWSIVKSGTGRGRPARVFRLAYGTNTNRIDTISVRT